MKKRFIAMLLVFCMVLPMLPLSTYAYDMGENGGVTVISSGDYYSAAIGANGSLWTWGRNDHGQLGNGTTDDSNTPIKVMSGIVSVSCGSSHIAVIKTDGSLWTWGHNNDGQLGNGNTNDSSVPTKVLDDIIAVSCGGKHTAAIKSDGSLWVFGSSTHNSVSTSQKTMPTKVMDDVIAVSAGNSFTAVIKTDNSLWTWGSNTDGQLGHDGGSPSRYPTQVMENVIAVSAGTSHCTAIKSDGSLWAWGSYMYGKLGTEDSETTPAISSGVISVSAGCYHTAAIKSDGSLWMWGNNRYGQLGNGGGGSDVYQPPFSPSESEYFQRTPERILDNMSSVSAGSVHTIALASDGTIWACGDNNYGQLGTGNTTASSVPVQIQLQQEPDIPPVSGDGSIISLSPTNGATNVGYDASNPPVFKITFDREIASSADQEFVAGVDLTLEDTFAIYRKSDDTLIYKPGADSHLRFTMTSDKKTLVVTPLNNHTLLNANTEYYVTMGEGFVKFADNSTSPVISKGNWVFKTGLFEKNGTFTFPGSNGKNIEYSYSYSDDFFYDTGNMYNHDLANMSLNLAMSAFNSLDAPASNYNEFVAAKNVRKLLSDLNFNSIETNIDDGNNSYSGMPYTNSIAAAYAKKNITTDYGDFTLIAVAIRGGGYEAEWGGNFTVGQNGNHKGFQLASDKVLAGLKEYINSQSISGDIKIWITGYSRAAATANLTAAAIDDGKLFIGTNAVDNSVVRLSTADVYAYTFETPMGTTNNTSSFLYNNIFNIVNPIDLVPKVAPDAWDFGRYGITYYMPSGNTDAVGYSDVIMRVTREYSKIVNGTDNGSLLAIKQLTNQSAILDKFLDTLSTQMPRTTYSPKYEHLLVPIASEVMGADGNQYGENIFWAIEEFCLRYPDDAADLVNALKEAVGNKIVWYIAAEQGFEQLYKALGWNGSTAVDTISMIGEIIFQSHYPEVTMAWMRTINSADGYGSGKYRKLYVNCPVDVSVYDSDNRLVARIVNDDPQIIENSLIGSYIDGDGQKIVILPTDMEYHVVIDATDNGTMTYTVDEYNIDKVTTERVVSYSDIDLTKGAVLTGLVENLDDVQKANYPLYRENETTPLKPDTNDGGEDSNQPNNPTQPNTPSVPNYGGDTSDSDPTYSITIPSSIVGGTVSVRPTSASEGQKVTITTKPNSGYRVGSITVTAKDDKQITVTDAGDNKYTFIMPRSKVDVKVEFVRKEVPSAGISFTDVRSDAYYYDAVVWAVEQGITAGTSATTFSPDASCTRAQMVSFLWRAAGSPEPQGSTNPFADVQAGTYYYDAVLWAVEQGITAGTSATTFSPDVTVTRGQTVTFLHRSAGSPITDNANPFIDVEASAYYAKAVQWAVDRSITSGTSATTFSPDSPCTRAQIVTFLYRNRTSQ